MASITREANGRRTVQFIGTDGKRRSIRLGKVPQRTADTVKLRVELIVAAKLACHAIDDETAKWLASLDDALTDKLAAVGLVPKRAAKAAATLGVFIDDYLTSRAITKPNTVRNYKTTRRLLVEHFSEAKPLSDVSAGDADEWRERLLRDGYSQATVGREVKRARQFFRAASRKRLIAENPFADVAAPAQVNNRREFFISNEAAQAVLDACPDAQWRLLFALSRYGGLRCPSEHLSLRLGDVDWERGRVRVTSPKTEHHDGGESRVIPLFPELRGHLEAVFDAAEPGTEYFITRYRGDNTNLRTQLLRIIRRAGLTPWPKLFHNLRASRETELAATYPLHVVCKWIGNSEVIAKKHYLQVTDADYEKAVQNPVQQAAETPRMTSQMQSGPSLEDGPLLALASRCDLVYKRIIPPRGVEPRFSG